MKLLDDDRGFVHQPNFAGFFFALFTREQGNGGIHRVFLRAEVEDVAVGLGAVEHAVGARERLYQTVVLEVFVHIQGVEVFAVNAGEQHVHDDGDVDLLGGRVVSIRPLLGFDALLNVLVIQVKKTNGVVGAEARVVVGQDGFERGFFTVGVNLVVLFFLRQVFLYLLHVGIALGGWRKHASDVERHKVGVSGVFSGLGHFEERLVLNGVVDAGGG